MPTTSMAPAFAEELKAQLALALVGEALEGRDVQVMDAMIASETKSDMCIIGDINIGSNEYPVIRAGRKPREERWMQHVWFVCFRPGLEATKARRAAFDMYSHLEDLLANDPSLGLHPTLRAGIVGYNSSTSAEASMNGYRVFVRAEVEVYVRLT